MQYTQFPQTSLSGSNPNHGVQVYSRKIMSMPTAELNNIHYNHQTQHRAVPVALQGSVVPSKGSLFVGDISFFCTEADLVRLFEHYGRVLHVEVRRNAAGESLRHGFAELENVDAAQRAINDLHSSKYLGRRIRVHWACVHVDKRQPRDRTTWTQIYVSFCSLRRDRVVSETLLDEIFSRFGAVADVTVKKHSLVSSPSQTHHMQPGSPLYSSASSPTASSLSSDHFPVPQQPVWTGYAFVYFYDRHDAELATQNMRTFESDEVGIRLTSSLSLRASLADPPASTNEFMSSKPQQLTNQFPALRPQATISLQQQQPLPQMQTDLFLRPSKLQLQTLQEDRHFAGLRSSSGGSDMWSSVSATQSSFINNHNNFNFGNNVNMNIDHQSVLFDESSFSFMRENPSSLFPFASQPQANLW